LLWNTMMSMSGSWFFVVASEAISVANQNITLPGIGSYISKAITEANGKAVLMAIVTMFVVILIYDQLFFRPLNAWATKFKADSTSFEHVPQTWLIRLLQRSFILNYLGQWFVLFSDAWINMPFLSRKGKNTHLKHVPARIIEYIWYILLTVL